MLIVATSVALVTIPAATGIYIYAKQKLIASESSTLIEETKLISKSSSQRMVEYELNLKAASRILAKALAAPPQAGEGAEFDRLVQQSADHAWRSPRKGVKNGLEASLFLPPDAPLDAAQKSLHVRSKRVLDIFGSAITSSTGNIWLLTRNKTEVIYDHKHPDFAWLMPADTDYTKTPWMTLTDPVSNTDRGVRWTTALYDGPSKSWLVSAVYPIDINGSWVGAVGTDISLNTLLPSLLFHSKRYSGEQHFLLDSQHNFLQAGPWQKQFEASPESFKPDLRNESDIVKLFAHNETSEQAHLFHSEVSLHGRKYIAIDMPIAANGWRYFRLIPTNEILAPMRKLFFSMIGIVLATGLLIGLLIDVAVKRTIVNRLQAMANAVRKYGLGELGARANLSGDDEISKTSHEFDAMANQLKSTLDAIPDMLFELGLDGRYYAVHAPDDALLTAQPHELIGKKVYEMLPQYSATVVMAAIQEAHEKGWSRGKQYQRNTPKGMLWFELSIARKSSSDNQNPRFLVLSRDITERKVAEDNLRISAIAFEAQESMMVSDANKVILHVNKAFTEITGYTADEVVGHTSMPLRSNLHDASFYAEIWNSVSLNGSWKGELYSKRKNGEVYPGTLSVTAVSGPGDVITHYVTSLVDITKAKITAEEIQFLAFYDPLTGLPNRRLLVERLSHALTANARHGKDGALLFIDLDHFKTLNDTLGHDVGDLLLQQVAKRLTACVREGDTVARLGGDEYVILLENLSEHAIEAATQAEAISAKILTALNQPYLLDIHEYHSTSSIGAALFSDHEQSQEDLLKHADIAMYHAKKAGRNALRFFDPQMQHAIHLRVDLERELRKAIEKQQFQLYYQVQTDRKGNAIGAEALIRWIHPERGLISPLEFIPLAEETGIILAIGAWVLETACAQLKVWQHFDPIRDISLSVNVSAKQFRQQDFCAQVQAAVERHDINPMLLKLELTESILLEDFEGTIGTINTLKKIGVMFSLDDFGTGYSSLQYLKRLPLQQLKIDQSFVRDILIDSSDQAIVRTIIAMAKSLELEVIAEGVETEEQRQYLLKIGCQSFQGYVFGKPMPIKEFEATLPED
jgi:diguanylate cyclase (GGDEF)-like protein/PAS domain S-box-containing protein